MKSSGGGHKRGRRRIYTPDKRLELERERDRFKKARKRKESADSKWLRATNYGYFERVEILHWTQFVDYLVHKQLLAERDRDSKARIEAATDQLLLAYVEERAESYGYFSRYHSSGGANPNFRGRSGAGLGNLNIKITPGLVEALGLEDECDNRRKIKRAAEELLFRIYSHIADISILDPWRTTGPHEQWPRAKARVGGMWNGNGLMEGVRARSYKGLDQ